MYCKKCIKNFSRHLRGGGVVSTALFKYVNDDLNTIQAAAQKRGDNSFKNVSTNLVNKLVAFGKAEKALKDKSISYDEKTLKEQQIKAEYLKLKTDYSSDWENLNAMKDIFYGTVPQVSSKWIVNNYIKGH
jgi:hypothetical protein